MRCSLRVELIYKNILSNISSDASVLTEIYHIQNQIVDRCQRMSNAIQFQPTQINVQMLRSDADVEADADSITVTMRPRTFHLAQYVLCAVCVQPNQIDLKIKVDRRMCEI